MSSHPGIQDALKAIDLKLPVLRCNSLQVFLPWEEIFNELEHQDYGDLISPNSWTIQAPLQPVRRDINGSAEIYPGTFRNGPLRHRLICEPNGHLYEVVDQAFWQGIPPKNFDMDIGDATFFKCLNIHKSYPKQAKIRWSLILRYDDLSESSALGEKPFNFAELRDYDFETWEGELRNFFRNYRVPPGQSLK